jgi:adenine phosphoribosyltransferase
MKKLSDFVRDIPHFPKQGITFKDISPLLQDHFDDVVLQMSQAIDWQNIDYVIGIESRGFILGAAMANKHHKGFIPIRKKGKLPPPVLSESYALEYGTDTIEMQTHSKSAKVLLVDDVLATGGTLVGALNLCQKNNFQVKGISVLINLTFLNNFHQREIPTYSVINY